jgi:hypothetical protein
VVPLLGVRPKHNSAIVSATARPEKTIGINVVNFTAIFIVYPYVQR